MCVTSLRKSAITKPALTISRQVPFLVINSPNSLDRNVESSDLARSFLTSLILAPLSPGEFLAARPVNVRPRDNLFSLRCIGDSAIVARKLFTRSYVRTFFNCVIKSRETKKNVNLCVVIVGRRETRFFLIKIEMSQERLETEGKQSVDLSQSFMLKEGYVMCKLNLYLDITKTECFRALTANS